MILLFLWLYYLLLYSIISNIVILLYDPIVIIRPITIVIPKFQNVCICIVTVMVSAGTGRPFLYPGSAAPSGPQTAAQRVWGPELRRKGLNSCK